MKIYQSFIRITTKEVNHFHDLTSVLQQELRKSAIENGILFVSVLHTTAAVILQESDPSVHEDGKLVLDRTVPENLKYEHIYEGEINAAAHQKQMLVGNSVFIPVSRGSLVLGTWQKPFLLELFRPMERRLFIIIIGSRNDD